MLNRINWRWPLAAAIFVAGLLLSRRMIIVEDRSFEGLWPNVTIALIAILICGAIFLQRPIAAFLILLPPVFGATVVMGVLGILHARISNTDLALGLALICMSINYGVAALHRLPSLHATWARSLQSPMVIVPTATVAMLLCNWFLGYGQIGLIAAVGLSAAAVFAAAVLPSISPSSTEPPWRKSPGATASDSVGDRHPVGCTLRSLF